MRLITRPCTLLTRTLPTFDSFGDPTSEEATSEALCELQPLQRRGTDSEVEDGNISETTFRIYFPGNVVPDNIDAVIVDGLTYEMVGKPNLRRNPRTGGDVFTEAFVRLMD